MQPAGTQTADGIRVGDALVAFRTDPNEAIGKRAWATARPAGAIASPLRPEKLGDEARVGATLAVAHPDRSSTFGDSRTIVANSSPITHP